MTEFSLTNKQQEAMAVLAGDATHIMLFGGSRSGKTFLLCRAVAMRAIKAPESRHAILRFRFNHVKNSVVLDTWPKMMKLCFPNVNYTISKTDWYCQFENGSQVWFGGLDDKERSEKILGMEFVTIYLNECSQIPQSSRDIVVTRLAQQADQKITGKPVTPLQMRMYYDCNPPSKAHWSYRLFVKKEDLDTKQTLSKPEDYVSFKINPQDNLQNLGEGYLQTLEGLGSRLRKRFLLGEYAEATANALFDDTNIEKWRLISSAETPDMVRIVIAVDPSGSGDTNNADNDAIGIVAAGLGIDGNGYLLADLTVKAGPATWGKVATDAYDRFKANCVVGEINFGGAMVEHVIQTARPRTPYRSVTATRGKSVRAEPVAALYEQGRIRHVGYYRDLEDELSAFTTNGYMGENSPNRADAAVWAFTELFGEIVAVKKKSKPVYAGYEPLDDAIGY
jgi:phage terminase large subunit-like protein